MQSSRESLERTQQRTGTGVMSLLFRQVYFNGPTSPLPPSKPSKPLSGAGEAWVSVFVWSAAQLPRVRP